METTNKKFYFELLGGGERERISSDKINGEINFSLKKNEPNGELKLNIKANRGTLLGKILTVRTSKGNKEIYKGEVVEEIINSNNDSGGVLEISVFGVARLFNDFKINRNFKTATPTKEIIELILGDFIENFGNDYIKGVEIEEAGELTIDFKDEPLLSCLAKIIEFKKNHYWRIKNGIFQFKAKNKKMDFTLSLGGDVLGYIITEDILVLKNEIIVEVKQGETIKRIIRRNETSIKKYRNRNTKKSANSESQAIELAESFIAENSIPRLQIEINIDDKLDIGVGDTIKFLNYKKEHKSIFDNILQVEKIDYTENNGIVLIMEKDVNFFNII